MGISRISEFWPGWSVTDVLGEGAYGKVYKAVKSEGGFDTYSAIKVVSIPANSSELKSLRSEGLSEDDSRTYFKGIVYDFINEIKLMENLKGASNIVSVEDYKILERTDTIGWNIYIRMELLMPLEDYMADNKLTEKDIIQIGIDLCSGLEICSQYNIIHRDIKPANIFVSKFGDYKLGDFGVAKELGKTSSAISSKGTYGYMAPEVAHGQRYDHTVDIYSLGIVLYTLLNNNRQPFLDPYSTQISFKAKKEAADRRLSGEKLPPPCNASPKLASVVLTACSHSANTRFKNPTAFKNALISCLNGSKASMMAVNSLPKDDRTISMMALDRSKKKEDPLPVDTETEINKEMTPAGITNTADKPDNHEVWNDPSLINSASMNNNSSFPPSSDRMNELYPVRKIESKGKRIGKTLILIAIIAIIAICSVLFVPSFFDNSNNGSGNSSPASQLIGASTENKRIRIEITESAHSQLGSVVPGEVVSVDPYVNVYSDSGDCWLFVELYMTEDFERIFEYQITEYWDSLDGYDNVYYMRVDDSKEDQSFGIFEGDCVSIPEEAAFDLSGADINLNYRTYALHTDQADSAQTAWKKIISSEGYTGE